MAIFRWGRYCTRTMRTREFSNSRVASLGSTCAGAAAAGQRRMTQTFPIRNILAGWGSGAIHRQARYQTDLIRKIARFGGIADEEQVFDCRPDCELLGDEDGTGTTTSADELAEVARQGGNVMAHKHPILAGCDCQDDRVRQALQRD